MIPKIILLLFQFTDFIMFQFFGILTIACCAPAPFATQVYFLIVVVTSFIGTNLLCLTRLRFPYFNKIGKQAVSLQKCTSNFFFRKKNYLSGIHIYGDYDLFPIYCFDCSVCRFRWVSKS